MHARLELQVGHVILQIFLEHLEEKDQFGRHEPHSGSFGPHHYLCTMNPHVWRVDVFSALEDVKGQGFEAICSCASRRDANKTNAQW